MRGSIPTNSDRVTLARDIHDGIAQDLVAVGYQLESLLARPDIDVEVRREIRNLRLTVTASLASVRRYLFSLRQGSEESLRTQLLQLYEEHAAGFSGSCDVEELTFSEETERGLLAMAGELLRNASRHSCGESIWLSLSTTSAEVILTVADDGNGGAAISPGRFGLVGIHEMVAEQRGTVKILGNHGSTVAISLPLFAV